jgi:hypothetical protein
VWQEAFKLPPVALQFTSTTNLATILLEAQSCAMIQYTDVSGVINQDGTPPSG